LGSGCIWLNHLAGKISVKNSWESIGYPIPLRNAKFLPKKTAGLMKGLLPSRKLTYPTWGKGKSSSNMPYQGVC